MKKLVFAISLVLFTNAAKSQCTNKIQIESILVNACNNNGTVPEEYNEMVRFKNGPNPLNISNISVGGSLNAANPVSGKWPNTNQHWNGLSQNATTSALTASLQATVISSCGKLLEPPAGIIPANKEVIMITSQQMTPAYNSFANLTDTIYVVYQTTLTTTGGHFANHTSTGTRNFVLFDNASGCSDTVHYDTQLLTTQPSTSNYDGGTVVYDNAGNATYTNIGCHAPFVPLSANAGTGGTICSNSTIVLHGSAAGPYLSFAWTGGLGTFSNGSALTTTYTPSAGESGTVTFTLTVNGKCVGTSATSTVAVVINAAPTPTVNSSNGASICNGSSTVLTASSSGTLTTTFNWNPGSHSNPYTVSPPTGTQIYTVDATNACGTTSAFYTVTTNPLPNITIINDSICKGANASLTASGADTYTWNTGVNGATISSANVTTNNDYTVTATNTLTTCQNNQVGHIIIRNAPTITTNSISICQGVVSVLTASGGASNSYTWSPGGPSGNGTYSVTPVNTTPIIVTGADIFGCINTNTVSVNAQPVFTINPGGICPGAQTVLTPNPASNTATTYSWAPLNITTTDVAPSVTVQPASTTHYTITSTNPSGCSYTQTDSVVVNNTINIIAPTNTLVCSGVTTVLSVSGASAYTWLASAGAVTPVNAGDYSSVLVNQTGSVSYTVSGSSGSCNSSTTFTIDVAPSFTISASVSPSASICPSGTVALSGVPASTYTYTWSGGVNDGVSFTPSSTQTYTLTGTDINGCKSITTQAVMVYPTTTISVTSPSICGMGSTATLTASGANSYTWSATTNGGNASTTTAVPSVNHQTYTVSGTDVNGCLTSVATSTVTINSLPVVSITANPGNAIICRGYTVSLTGNGANTYTWSTLATTAGITDVPNGTKTYTVVGTDGNGCSNLAVQTVTVNSLPNLTVNPANICLGFSTSLIAAGAQTYTWSTSAMGSTINVSPNNTQTYSVAGTDANGCVGATTTTVTVNALPTITVSSNPNGAAICAGANATLTASSTSSLSVTFDWDNAGTNINPIVVSPITQTPYTVVGTDINGCQSAPYTVTVNINPLPTAQTISGNTFVCVGAMGVATVLSASNNGYWTGPAPSTATLSANSTTANITHGGVYTLHTINGCGDATTTYTVTADSAIASFTASPTTGQAPLSVTFTNTSQGNSLTYNWNFGNGGNSTNINPLEVYTTAGTYQAVLIATDNLGCKGMASEFITANDIPSVIVIPNVFSPNGDSINDIFMVNASGISNFDCKVYDRWGLLLHEWAGIDGGWDGRAKNGSLCTDGTYFYLITYSDNLSKSYTKNGFFQLIR